MIYVGLDVSSKSFVAHAIDEKKKVVFRDEIEPTRSGLRALDQELGKQRKIYVIEAGNQMKWIAEALKKLPLGEVHVVHPNHIKWINESTAKTDKIDARKLAELARADMLPRRVKVVEGSNRSLREFSSARQLIQSKRVAMVNTIRGYCKQEGHKLPEKFFQSEGWDAKLSKLKVSETLKVIINSFMTAVEQLKASEDEITQKMAEISTKETNLLETIPAIGKLSSRVVASAIDGATRFDSKKSVAKYGALTPRSYQSGNTVRMGRICHDGRHEVRRVLLQCAHTITRMKSPEVEPLKNFYNRIEKRAGKKRAVVALARKLLTTAYGVLKSGKPYDPRELMPAKAA